MKTSAAEDARSVSTQAFLSGVTDMKTSPDGLQAEAAVRFYSFPSSTDVLLLHACVDMPIDFLSLERMPVPTAPTS